MRIFKICRQHNQIKTSENKSDIEYKINIYNSKNVKGLKLSESKDYKNVKAYLNKKQIISRKNT